MCSIMRTHGHARGDVIKRRRPKLDKIGRKFNFWIGSTQQKHTKPKKFFESRPKLWFWYFLIGCLGSINFIHEKTLRAITRRVSKLFCRPDLYCFIFLYSIAGKWSVLKRKTWKIQMWHFVKKVKLSLNCWETTLPRTYYSYLLRRFQKV